MHRNDDIPEPTSPASASFDLSRAWKGVVSVEAWLRFKTDTEAIDEIDFALAPPFNTARTGPVLMFGQRDWLWLTHNWDPFVYISGGRVQAAGAQIDGKQLIRFDLDFRVSLVLLLVVAGLLLMLIPSPFGPPIAGFLLLAGLLWLALVPHMFLLKLKRLLDRS